MGHCYVHFAFVFTLMSPSPKYVKAYVYFHISLSQVSHFHGSNLPMVHFSCAIQLAIILIILQDLTGLPSTSLAWGRGWHQDKEAQGLSSVLVYYNNLLCLLTTLSTTYSRLAFNKY